MSLIQSPCHNCESRTLECHFEGKCEKWAEYRAKIDRIRANKIAENDIVSVRVAGIIRRKKKYDRNRY
jgi:hypothetical protein